ncbi:MAG: hypothetical protein ABI648_04005 [Betaproteobacteria bacterium]|jgi:N-acetyl-gamma-glutamyl-phosphate reductase
MEKIDSVEGEDLRRVVSVRLNADAGPRASSEARNAEANLSFSEKRHAVESSIDVLVPGRDAAARSLSGVNICRITSACRRADVTVAIVAGPRSRVKAAAGRAWLNLNQWFGLRAPIGNEHINPQPCR